MGIKVSVLGTGETGATIAQKLADDDWAGEILLVDTAEGPPQGKALDLMESNPVLLSGAKIRGSHRLEDIEGSSCIVIADYGSPGGFSGRAAEAGRLLEEMARRTRDPILIGARDDLEILFPVARSHAGFSAARMIGVGPLGWASILRHRFADAIGCSARHLEVSLVGAPPQEGGYAVLASVGGVPVERLLTPAVMRSVARRVAASRPPGARTLAAAAAAILRDMARAAAVVQSCFVWGDGAYGARDLFLCAPALISAEGVERILEIPLDPVQRVAVDRGLDALARVQGAPR